MFSSKLFLRKSLRRLLLQPWFYRSYQLTLLHLSEFFRIQRATALEQAAGETLDRLSPEKKVVSGPFAGMVYPEHSAFGSSFPPKLIGSYEHELHAVIEPLLSNKYSKIIDIGCAEGYYAVGFALRFPLSEVLAFDPSPCARSLCCDMARINGVAKRVQPEGFCDPATLTKLTKGETCLILCDCEGYEEWLFPQFIIPSLGHSTLIIETHDFVSPTITKQLKDGFLDSHVCTEIVPGDPEARLEKFRATLSSATSKDWLIRHLLDEGRPLTQCWLIFTPRT